MDTITVYRAVGVTEMEFGWNRTQLGSIFGSFAGLGGDVPLELRGAFRPERALAEDDARAIMEAHKSVWACRIEEAITTTERYADFVQYAQDKTAKMVAEAERQTLEEAERLTRSQGEIDRLINGD